MPRDPAKPVALGHFDGGGALLSFRLVICAVGRVQQGEPGQPFRGQTRHLHRHIAAHRQTNRHQRPVSQRQRITRHLGDAVTAKRIGQLRGVRGLQTSHLRGEQITRQDQTRNENRRKG